MKTGGGYHNGVYRGPLSQSALLPPQPSKPVVVQSATEYFEEMVEKVVKNLPEKVEKSLEYWLGRTSKSKCKMHPSKISKTCR